MEQISKLTPYLYVSRQIGEGDLGLLAAQGFKGIINNRPDGESEDQPHSTVLMEAANRLGLEYRHLPVVSGKVTDEDVSLFAEATREMRGPILAFCRTGTRSTTLWALSQAHHLSPEAILATASDAGYDLSGLKSRLLGRWNEELTAVGISDKPISTGIDYEVVIVGGGAAGISTAASILKRRPSAQIAIIEPKDSHYYQPGWTLVGGGAFDRRRSERPMKSCMPAGVKWIRAAAAEFQPQSNTVILEDGERISYKSLVVCPGIKLCWDEIEGLNNTLGKNGVTSNYLFNMAPYTWKLVQAMKEGTALFTQPPMPIKCAGAPQKAMYLSCDHWLRQGVLKNIDVEFNNAGGVLFGVKEFVPPLMKYVEKYGAKLAFNSNLKAIDGPAKKAWFEVTDAAGGKSTVEKTFDMIHVVPPQKAPDFIRNSPLADQAGWVEVDPETLRHTRYGNIFSLGDVCSAPNAKTAAAVRKQAPVVAVNVVSALEGRSAKAVYDGYGSCPLTVEKGKVVFAEFGYGGKLLPTFPLDPTVPRRSMWWLKAVFLPNIYFDLMLKGHEWLAGPKVLQVEPKAHEAPAACNDKPGN